MTRRGVTKGVGVAVGGSSAAVIAVSSTMPGLVIGIAAGIVLVTLAVVVLSAARAKNPITQANSIAVLRLLAAVARDERVSVDSEPTAQRSQSGAHVKASKRVDTRTNSS